MQQYYELHRHLDVSLRLSTLRELAQKKGIVPQSTSLDSFRDQIVLSKPLNDLASVLATFTLFQEVLDRPETFERVGYEVVEDCRAEGTTHVELRFSPSFVSEKSGLSWDESLAGFERGIARALNAFPEMRAGLICIASRDYGAEAVDRTVDFYLRRKSRFIGLDLAGNENQFPCRLFEASFSKAKKAGARITVHAGEASGPENIWEAIELLGAERIGHGISSVKDPVLIDYLAEKKICLEMCPTSNWLTQAVPSFEAHPLAEILRAGVPATINTDDPSVFGCTLPMEKQIALQKMGLTSEDIGKCNDFAREASFIL